MLNLEALNQLKSLKQEIRDSRELATGVIRGTANRFGFVVLDDDKGEIFLSPDEMQKVFPADRVEVELQKDDKGKDFATIEKVLNSPLRFLVGRYVCKGNAHFVETDVPGMSRWLYLPPNKRKNGKDGDYIYCRIKQHPFQNGKPQAEVLENLGDISQPNIERRYNILKYALEDRWDNDTIEQVNHLSEQLIADQVPYRRDLRHETFVTIDSPSTTDMDDALAIEESEQGWHLRVAIADPAALIAPDSALERTLYRRTSSVYFPGDPVPMLPEAISSQLCSLVPEQDRLVLVCDMTLALDGSLQNFELYEAVIHSRAKLSYGEVAQYLNRPEDSHPLKSVDGVQALVDQLWQAAQQLNLWRQTHALPGDNRPDFRLRLNEQRKVESIEKIEGTAAHQIVEECMIVANRCAAQFINEKCQDGLYIAHSGVRTDRRESIQALVNEQFSDLEQKDINSLEGFRDVLQAIDNRTLDLPLRSIITRQLDRSLFSIKQAPHFGMGLPGYTTFTSPLRKANDFYVHRLIKQAINAEPFKHFDEAALNALQEKAKDVRSAVNETENWLKRQYLAAQPKDVYEGVIVRMNASGFTVQLTANGIEGFISTRDLPEKYSFNNDAMTLSSKTTRYTLDQVVNVMLDKVDERRKQLVFKLSKTNETKATTEESVTPQ